MPDAALAERYRDELIRVRRTVSARVEGAWRNLGSWDRADVPRFQAAVLPTVAAGQRRTVALTDAYLARATRSRPVGLPVADLVGAGVRNGTAPATVYERPFVQLWSALKSGSDFMDAMNAAGVRAAQSAATDVSLTMRDSAAEFQNLSTEFEQRVIGWERVLDPEACAFCAAASTQRYQYPNPARVVDLQEKFDVDNGWPMHANCNCTLAPIFDDNDRSIKAFNDKVLRNIKDANAGQDAAYWQARHFRVDGQTGDVILPEVAVHEHGELGAVLTDAAHQFSGPGDIPG